MAPSLPPTASPLYTSLYTTALSFLAAQALDPTHPLRMNFARLESFCTPDFSHTWGHNFSVSQSPRLQGTLSFAQFVAHLQSMLPNLESWENEVMDVTVDEVRRKVVLRVSFWMKMKGAQESVENDLVWGLEMDEEEGKVRRSEEFVDMVAVGRLRELMTGKGQVGG